MHPMSDAELRWLTDAERAGVAVLADVTIRPDDDDTLTPSRFSLESLLLRLRRAEARVAELESLNPVESFA